MPFGNWGFLCLMRIPLPLTRQDKTITRQDNNHKKIPRQIKAWQDTARQEQTRQGQTKQDKTRQVKTRQDKTRQCKTMQDETRHDKTQLIFPLWLSLSWCWICNTIVSFFLSSICDGLPCLVVVSVLVFPSSSWLSRGCRVFFKG